MKTFPASDYALVIRADFSNDAAWESICDEIRQPVGGFNAYVELVNDPQYEGLTGALAAGLVSPDAYHSYVFIVDSRTINDADHPILVVDLFAEPGREFRAVLSEVQGIENNLSIANIDFADFADSVDGDGIFRGFPSQ